MKRITIAIVSILMLALSTYGQRRESDIALKEYFADAEFFLAQEYYKDALNDFIQVYKRGYEDNYNINYRIGVCYLNIPGQKDKSIAYLEKAKEGISLKYRESTLHEQHAPIDVYLYLGNAYRVNNRLDMAVAAYTKYKELLPENEEDLHKYTDQQIEACNIAGEFMRDPVMVNFRNLGETLNSSGNDFRGVISGDGKVIVYMQSQPFYDAVYYSEMTDNGWSKPQNITPQIMSDGDQFVCDLSFKGDILYLSREDEFNSDIYISRYDGSRWSRSEALGAGINTKYWESHASVTQDGKTLYFASNRKGGMGGMDIYTSQLNSEGKWGEAKNLGEEINTKLNEDTPFITEDGKTLFYSSQSFTTMGGYDIFKSTNDISGWSLPENLGYPVNSTDDDLFYYPLENGEYALMARIEEDGYGELDLYEVVYGTLVPEPVAEDTTAVPSEVAVVAVPEETTPEEGKEAVVVPPVVPAKVVKLELEPVLFGFDKSTISEQGREQLDKLAAAMNEDKELTAVLTGYTDPLGPESYNLVLSKKRAESTINYLVSKGIDKSRLKALGKGETNFIAPNTKSDGSDYPEGRKYNRRVEFEIRGTDDHKIMIKRIDPVPTEVRVHQK
jgi:outer membrane protein OmpA-like peptidoglycan-associated protein